MRKEPEEIEGLDSEESSPGGDYSIDTVLIRNEMRTVHDVLRRIEKGSFVMDPEFHRDFIWKEDKQSKFIESVLMRIPLPVFYLAEDERGRLIVVDGLQRLSTFRNFVNNELSLKLPGNAELNKKKFEDLAPKFQNRIEDCNLMLYVIDSKVPERARLDIFERVNDSVPLTRQQMRNRLYVGDATRFLIEQADNPFFLKATGQSLSRDTMRDREFINRFCAFQLLPLEAYRGDMDDFLAEALKHMNRLGREELSKLSLQFRTSMKNNYTVFGEHAFRKSIASQGVRSVLNASIWDVMSTGLSRRPEHMVEARAERLKEAFVKLMEDGEFQKAITTGTNEKRRVLARFSATEAMFQEVFDADPT